MSIPQARYWMLTLPHEHFLPYLPSACVFIKGQLECGESGYLHWQIVVSFKRAVRRSTVREIFGSFHAEPTLSSAADAYVWKDDTAILGTRFELGKRAFKPYSKLDWESVWQSAISGQLYDIPANIRVAHYRTLQKIRSDHLQPLALERSCFVFWGATGLGKTRDAWEQAGINAYPKAPTTKFWDGYQNQEHVVIDEFRGDIAPSHLLRWLDRYPVIVEIKGSSIVFSATKIWITSNLHPSMWYPSLDKETFDALMRRMVVVEYKVL